MSARFCTACGHQVNPGMRFCTQCGNPVQQPVEPTPSAPPSAPATSTESARGQWGPSDPPAQAAQGWGQPPQQQPPSQQQPQGWGQQQPPQQQAPYQRVPQQQAPYPQATPWSEQPQQQSAPSATWQQPGGGAVDRGGALHDAVRVGLAVIVLLGALATSWNLEDRTTDKPLVLIFLVLALFALVSDFVLQRAVIGRDLPAIPRLLVRGVLCVPLLVTALLALLTGEFGDRHLGNMSEDNPLMTLYPGVGFGPVLAIAGALLVVGGRWKDREELPRLWWQGAAAAAGVAAALLSMVELIRGLQGVSDLVDEFGDDGPSTFALWAASLGPWVVVLLVSLAIVAGVFLRPDLVWPGACVAAGGWVLTAVLIAVIKGVPDGAVTEGEGAYAIGGSALLLGALTLSTAPALSSPRPSDPSTPWVNAARGGAVVAVAGMAACAVQMIGVLSVGDDFFDNGVSKGAVVWLLIACLFGGVGALVTVLLLRQPAQGRLVGAIWGIGVALVFAVTWAVSDTVQDLLSQAVDLGLTSAFVPASMIAIPAGVAVVLLASPALRAQFGPLVPSGSAASSQPAGVGQQQWGAPAAPVDAGAPSGQPSQSYSPAPQGYPSEPQGYSAPVQSQPSDDPEATQAVEAEHEPSPADDPGATQEVQIDDAPTQSVRFQPDSSRQDDQSGR